MAVRIHVLRTCDRCGRPIEVDGAVPLYQLKEGDTVPEFQRTVLRVTREEVSLDDADSAPTVKVLGLLTDICDPCTGIVERALDTLLKRPGDDEDTSSSGSESGTEPKRKRAGRTPRSIAPDMPGPHGLVTTLPVSSDIAFSPIGEVERVTTEPAGTFTFTAATSVSDELVDEPF